MGAVLIVGQDPDTVDFTDPALLPGLNAEKVHAGLALARKQLTDRGHSCDICLTDRGETAEAVVAAQLAGAAYDCVVVGAGIRLPAGSLMLFEKVINAIHRHAPGAAIAFNTRPDDSGDAAARWLPRA